MSEALFMPQSIGSIIGSILTTAFNLGVLARNISNAPAHIQQVSTEADLCKILVLTIKALLYQIETNGVDKSAQDLIYISTLARVLVGCQEVLDSLEQEVEGLMEENMRIGKNNRVRWVWREQEIDRHLKSLEASKLALNIALNVLNIHQGWEIRKQNAHILNCMTGNNTATGSLILPQEAMRPTGSRKLGLALSTVSEVESAGDGKPASDTESESLIIPPELNNIYQNSTGASNTSTSIQASESDHFETVLLTSRVYQKKYSKSKSPLLQSNVTWSELHHSGASIFGYRSRSSLPVALALVKTRAPIAILTKNRNRLNEALFEATRKQDITAMSIFLDYAADINAVEDIILQETPLFIAVELKNVDVVQFLLLHGANVNAIKANSEVALHVAEQADVIKLLLQHGADIEAMDNKRETALLKNARSGHLENVKVLLEARADIRKKNARGQTALHVATEADRNITVRYLLGCGADIESVDDENKTPLFVAARAGYLEVVKTLLETGADIRKKNARGKTVLHDAAWYQTKDIVKFLLQHGADIESANDNKETPLFWAAQALNLEVVKILLEAGADFKKRNALGRTVLHVAAKANRLSSKEIVKCLLRRGADIESADDNNETPLFMAVGRRKLNMVKTLLEAGADFKKKNALGQTVLHVAVKAGQLSSKDIVKCLLRRGANTESADDKNETPLFIAARGGAVEVVKTLLEAGADFKKKNALGRTVLHVAAMGAELWGEGIVRCLLQHGADIESADNENETALFMAARGHFFEVMKTLLEAGADLKKKNTMGQTVLHIIAGRGWKRTILRDLLRRGADIESADNENETPLFMAARAGNLEAVKILLEAGTDREKKNTSGQRAVDVADPIKERWKEICYMLGEV